MEKTELLQAIDAKEDELEVFEEELKHRIKRLGELKREVSDTEKLIFKLQGSGWEGYSGGLISRVEGEIKLLKLKLSHCDKLVVVWSDGKESDDIVAKVTAKRIFVSKPGCSFSDTYNKDGTPVAKWAYCRNIDIEATFGGPVPSTLK